jgi:hypothetical protein
VHGFAVEKLLFAEKLDRAVAHDAAAVKEVGSIGQQTSAAAEVA